MLGDNEYLIMKRSSTELLRAILEIPLLREPDARAILLKSINSLHVVIREYDRPIGHIKKLNTLLTIDSGKTVEVSVTLIWGHKDGIPQLAPDGKKALVFF